MVEVFKTDVTNELQARNIAGVIEDYFEGYKANFDLDDRDNILRIEITPLYRQTKNIIDVDVVVNLLKELGVKAEVLPDVVEDVDFLLPAGRVII